MNPEQQTKALELLKQINLDIQKWKIEDEDEPTEEKRTVYKTDVEISNFLFEISKS